MFLALQFAVYLKSMFIPMPANYDDFTEEVRKIVDFSLLKPESIIRLFYPKFDPKDYLGREVIQGESWSNL